MERRKDDFETGKALVLSGHKVLVFHPELVNDDYEEADDRHHPQ